MSHSNPKKFVLTTAFSVLAVAELGLVLLALTW